MSDTMRFAIAVCPTCGGPPEGSVDLIPGTAMLHQNDDGTFDWEGETEVHWDGQYNIAIAPDTMTVQCWQGHEWTTPYTE